MKMKITIEGIGTFSIPSEAATYFQEIAEERIAAIARAEAAEKDAAECRTECERLQARGKAMQHATCSVCDRHVNREIDTVVCEYCYERHLA